MRSALWVALAILELSSLSATAAGNDPIPVRFSLDGLSMVSVGDKDFVPIPPGRLTLRAYPSGKPGNAALRLDPADFGTKPFTISGATLSVTLARPGVGHATSTPEDGVILELEVLLRLTTTRAGRKTSQELPIRFTTEALEAWNNDGSKMLRVTGTRANPLTRVVQLVGKATAPREDPHHPGAAVYVVLSGTLDRIPGL